MENKENKENKITGWIPKHEYEALKALKERCTVEQQNQMSYFFWNNFSMDGYDEYLKTQNKWVNE